jgi:hypothetical protein
MTACSRWTAATAGLLLCALQACGGPVGGAGGQPPADTTPTAVSHNDIHVVGVIRHSDLEGGYYAIEAPDGISYDPTNLALEFRQDGLPIEADLRRRDDMAGIHMRGPIVEVIRIRARSGQAGSPLPAFANRAWKVAASSGVERGTLYVFLGDGTLLIASAHGTPALGRWEPREGGLTLVEEGIRYSVDILAQAADSFRIRVHSPGEPLTISFVPAGAP